MPSGSKKRAKQKASGSKPAAADPKANAEPSVGAASVKAVPDVVARGAENASQAAGQPSQATTASGGPAKASAGIGGGAVPLKVIENRTVLAGNRTAEEGVKSVLKGSQGEKAASGKGKAKTKKASFAEGTLEPTPSERHRRSHAQESGLGSGAMSPISVGSRDGSSSYPPSPSSFSSLDAMLEEAADLWASHSHNASAAHNDDAEDSDTDPYNDTHDATYNDTDRLRGPAEGNDEAEAAWDSFWDARSLLSGITASNSGRPPLDSIPARPVTNSAAGSVAAVPLAPQATAATDTIKQLEASAAQAASSAASNSSKQPEATPAPTAAIAAPSQPPPQPAPEPASTLKAGATEELVPQVQATQNQAAGSSKIDALSEASAKSGSSQVTPAAEAAPQPVPAAAADASPAGGEAQLSEAEKVKATQEEPEAMTCTGTVYWLFGFGKK